MFLYHFEEGEALHAFELPYVFGFTDPRLGAATLVDSLRQEFQTAFTSFARAGAPRPFRVDDNGLFLGFRPPWPPYTTAGDRHIALRTAVSEGEALSRGDCDFLESIGAVQ